MGAVPRGEGQGLEVCLGLDGDTQNQDFNEDKILYPAFSTMKSQCFQSGDLKIRRWVEPVPYTRRSSRREQRHSRPLHFAPGPGTKA